MQLPNEAVFFEKTILSAAEQAAESEDLMEFFQQRSRYFADDRGRSGRCPVCLGRHQPVGGLRTG